MFVTIQDLYEDGFCNRYNTQISAYSKNLIEIKNQIKSDIYQMENWQQEKIAILRTPRKNPEMVYHRL